MQDEQLDFLLHVVPILGRLPAGARERDRNLAQKAVGRKGGKGQDVCGVIFFKKIAVQTPQFSIGGEQAAKRAATGNKRFQAFGEGAELAPSNARCWNSEK